MTGQLQLRAVSAPDTGNCMAIAIVQALCDADVAAEDTLLAAEDTLLAAAAGSLKTGIKHAGQLHPGEQFPHDTRGHTHRSATWMKGDGAFGFKKAAQVVSGGIW
ncbi:hypothetical protein CCR75_006759 [Bremia lactucae]|uniref:Uncharacterized protein n=1 Tax=Bremia lactucae TaxID=4779 RepID=A0A976IBF6_BRELC|nr:hypothetical protein CCR75_006759 [Bremia lactucae]